MVKPEGKKVNVYESSLIIPTYPIGEHNKNPYFVPTRYIKPYPYTIMENLSNNSIKKEYKAIVMENDFLKCTWLKGMGGNIYSVVDKTNDNNEVFYKDRAIKYALVGIRGAWLAQGIEFNFPNSHSVTSVSEVDMHTEENNDGSASLFVGNIDKVTRMSWQVKFTLFPYNNYLETEMNIENNTDIKQLYWFWVAAGIVGRDDLQFIFPTRRIKSHQELNVCEWPNIKGIDHSWLKNVKDEASLFVWGSNRDFFGAYYNDSNHGVIHIADHNEVLGKKVWEGGAIFKGSRGEVWAENLSDDKLPHEEIQSGHTIDQIDYEYLNPHQSNKWKEYWYPIKGTDGFVYAEKEIAINVKNKNDKKTELKIYSTTDFENISVIIDTDKKRIFNKKMDLTVGQTVSCIIEHENIDKYINLKIVDNIGKTILTYNTNEPIDGLEIPPEIEEYPKEKKQPETAQEMYLAGLAEAKAADLENKNVSFKDPAIEWYKKSIEIDPGYTPSLLTLAEFYYNQYKLSEAEKYVKIALERDPRENKANYYLGLIYSLKDDDYKALDYFSKFTQYSENKSIGYMLMGSIYMKLNNFEFAENYFKKSYINNEKRSELLFLLAAVSRKLNKNEDAKKYIKLVLSESPINHLAKTEEMMLSINTKNFDLLKEEWHSLLSRDIQNYLEIAVRYLRLNLFEDAILVLILSAEKYKDMNPMVCYYLAYLYNRVSITPDAKKWYGKALTADIKYVFPYRLETFLVLEKAVEYNSADSNAYYFLGNLLFSKKCYSEGLNFWKKSYVLDQSNSVCCRNIGFAFWKFKESPKDAVYWYKMAIKNDPQDYSLYVDLSKIYEELGFFEEIENLYEKIPQQLKESNEGILLIKCRILFRNKKYEEVLSIIRNNIFHPYERERSLSGIYKTSNIELGKKYLKEGRAKDAFNCFEDAKYFPKNTGLGNPYWSTLAREIYWQNRCSKKIEPPVMINNKNIKIDKTFESGEKTYTIFENEAVTFFSFVPGNNNVCRVSLLFDKNTLGQNQNDGLLLTIQKDPGNDIAIGFADRETILKSINPLEGGWVDFNFNNPINLQKGEIYYIGIASMDMINNGKYLLKCSDGRISDKEKMIKPYIDSCLCFKTWYLK